MTINPLGPRFSGGTVNRIRNEDGLRSKTDESFCRDLQKALDADPSISDDVAIQFKSIEPGAPWTGGSYEQLIEIKKGESTLAKLAREYGGGLRDLLHPLSEQGGDSRLLNLERSSFIKAICDAARAVSGNKPAKIPNKFLHPDDCHSGGPVEYLT